MANIERTVSEQEQVPGALVQPAEAQPRTMRMPARWRLQRQWQDALLRRMLALADASAAFLVSVSLATFLGGGVRLGLWSAVFLPLWIVLAKLHGLYDRDQRSLRHLTVDEIPSIFMWALTGTAVVSALLFLLPHDSLEVSKALWMWLIAGSAAFVFRGTMRFVWRRIVPPENTLIVGTGPLAEATRRKLDLFPDIHVVVAGAREELPTTELHAHPSWADETDRIILASQQLDEALIAELVQFCRARQIKLSVVPPARGVFGTAVQLDHVADLPVVEYNTWAPSRSTLALKRVMDFVLSLAALVLLSPLFVLIAIAIAVGSRGPILFGQRRAGVNAQPFRLYKFRTMVWNAEELLPQLVAIDELADPMFKLPNDPRVTRVGRVLRRASLDELPQLANVLKGEMSLVGPRPEEVELVEMYAPEHRFRLKVKPGLTGPMQVYGRGQLTFDERLAVEREYIENLSLTRDLRILAMTLAAVVSGHGAY
jgi:exopolysaccharide biosynthesis polyprenyl glycosylphosphotransferase